MSDIWQYKWVCAMMVIKQQLNGNGMKKKKNKIITKRKVRKLLTYQNFYFSHIMKLIIYF